ncbi:MAG: AMP-binding protein, partial [Pseudomonadota bacterium]
FLPERFDPGEIRAMLEAGEINAISAVPSLWRLVLAAPEAIGEAGAAVRWIEIGSQYMSRAEKEAMKRLFPNAKIVQHYGLTEASRTTFLDISATEGDALESVGSATGGASVDLGEDDAIRIRGEHVAIGMLDVSGAITPLTDAEGRLQTKDRGALRDGRLWYLGRLDDQINVAGVKTSAERVEREIRELAGEAGEFAIVPVPDPLRGDRAVLALTSSLGDRAGLIERAAEIALRRQGVAQSGPLETITVDALPTTGTGKVQRRILRELFEAEEPAAPQGGDLSALSDGEREIAKIWRSVVGRVDISADQSFYDLGGDSLSSVQIGLAMERAGVAGAAVKATMEGRALRDIADLAEAGGNAPAGGPKDLPQRTVESWSISAARGVMVLSVLLSHWAPGVFERLQIDDVMDRFISVIYRMGTPGFAIMFGVGLGYFMLPGFPENRASVRWRLRLALILVASGLALRGIVVVIL